MLKLWYLGTNQAKELQELRKIVFGATKSNIVCERFGTTNDKPSIVSQTPVSSSSSIDEGGGDNLRESNTANENETKKDPSISGNASLSDDPDATYNVELNHATKVALKLNLVHTLSQHTFPTYVAFNMDGKYLATASGAGVVHIFDVTTGKKLR